MSSIAFDQLNEAILNVEKALAEKHNTASAEVPLTDGFRLGYGKLDGKWVLYVADELGLRVRLTSSSIRFRVQACSVLTALCSAILEGEQTLAWSVDDATNAYKRIAADLKER